MTGPVLRFLAGLALAAAPLAAQPASVRLAAGVRARVTAPPRVGWITGTVVVADSARVVLRDGSRGRPDTVLLAAVQAVDVSRGRPRGERTALGLVFGALAGGTLGYLGGTMAARGRDPGDEGAIVKGLGTIAGAAVGAVIGATIGAGSAKEQWDVVWRR